MASSHSDEKKRLYKRMLSRHRAQYINYEKYFLVAASKKKTGHLFDYLTTIVAALLLYFVSQSTSSDVLDPWVIFLAGTTAVLSFANVVGNWNSTANECYKAGQLHHSLYRDFDEMLKEKLPDPNNNYSDLKPECEALLDKQFRLNMATPQLSSKWYYRIMYRDMGTEWDYDTDLQDIESGITRFHNSNERKGISIWIRRNIIWPLI